MGKQKVCDAVLIWHSGSDCASKKCLCGKSSLIYQLPRHSFQKLNNCDVTNLGPSSVHYQWGNALHITRGREEITIFTPPISLSGADTLQNKSQCLSLNLVWQRVAASAILGSLWCQSPISPVTFFQRKSRFPRDSALCNFHSVFLPIEQRPSSPLACGCSLQWPEKGEIKTAYQAKSPIFSCSTEKTLYTCLILSYTFGMKGAEPGKVFVNELCWKQEQKNIEA